MNSTVYALLWFFLVAMAWGRKTLNGQEKEGEQGFVGERMWMKEDPMRGWNRGSTKVYDRDKLFRVQEDEVKNDGHKRYKDEEYNVTAMRKTFEQLPSTLVLRLSLRLLHFKSLSPIMRLILTSFSSKQCLKNLIFFAKLTHGTRGGST